jgi:hypothetical protein
MFVVSDALVRLWSTSECMEISEGPGMLPQSPLSAFFLAAPSIINIGCYSSLTMVILIN